MSLRVTSTPIVGTSLAQLAISGADTPWFAPRPRSADEWLKRAETIRESLVDENWLDALRPAFGAGVAAQRLERAARSGFVVTAGQQPGLFGGPLYTWWKALSALALADALEARTGLPVAPVFWAATDDSDFAESSHTAVATQDGVERLEMPEPPGTGVALAQVPLPDVGPQLAMLEAAAGSASSSEVLAFVRRAYNSGQTIGGAYVELLRSVLEPLGVSVLDAAHQSVRIAAHPVLRRALERSVEIEAALAARSAELRSEGHVPQVKLVEGRTLAFSETDGRRDRIRIVDAVSTAVAAAPGTLGPNVLLRPIVERSILPTVAYLGGPAEIAYFAQVTAVAGALGVPAPLIAPRWSGFVVEPRIDRILARHGLTAEDFRDPHAVETRIARGSLPADLTARLTALRDTMKRSIESLSTADGSDLAPPTVLQGLTRNVSRRLDRLERRFAAGVKRRGNDALRDATIARGALFPLGAPQERVLNAIPLLARYGEQLMSPVMAEVRVHTARIA